MTITKQLIIEAPKKDIVKKILTYISKENYKKWSNMNVLSFVSHNYYLVNTPDELQMIKEIILDVWSQKANETNCKPCVIARANMLRNSVKNVMESRPASLIIEKNMTTQSLNSAVNRIAARVADQLDLPSPSSSATAATTKKRKKVMPKDFKGLNAYDQASLLVDSCGENGTIDMRKGSVIPKRFEAITKKITKKLPLLLIPRLKKNEHLLLKQLSKAKTLNELAKVVESISIVDSEDELAFIKILVNKLVMLYKHNSLKKDHNECWYRVNVYSDTFDLLFLTSSLFESKRAECESVIIKTLKELKQLPDEQKNCRLDFILESSSNDRFFEQLFCEDKPIEKKSANDIEKADLVRSSSLKYWLTLLPYKECLNYIDSTSCHFNKLTLRVYGTKLIDNRIIHYVKKETNIPNDISGSQLADYIIAVLSLLRHVSTNLKKIKVMCEVASEDDLIFLKNTSSVNTFREDSPEDSESTCSSNSSQSSELSLDVSLSNEWEMQERKKRIMDKIKAAIEGLEEEENADYAEDCWEDLVPLQ